MKKNSFKLAMVFFVVGSGLFSTKAFAEETPIIQNYESNGVVTFIPNEDGQLPVDPNTPDPEKPVSPWDPTTPDHKPNPGTKGKLSLDYASSIDFGKNKISAKDATYYAEPQYLFAADGISKDESTERPNYVQVTDARGTGAGWTLTVKQEGQFAYKGTEEKPTTTNMELTGAAISFAQGTADAIPLPDAKPNTYAMELTPGTAAKVMDAKAGVGAGTWVSRFGTVEDHQIDETTTVRKNKAISLFVPGGYNKDAVRYETKLTWTLTDVPGEDI